MEKIYSQEKTFIKSFLNLDEGMRANILKTTGLNQRKL